MGRHRIRNWVYRNAVGAWDAMFGASGTITDGALPVGQADGTVVWSAPETIAFEPVVTGGASSEIVFDSNGDIIMVRMS
jgi:hypothetical protein